MIEAAFKAFARALREAVSIDPERDRRALDQGNPEPNDARIAILDYGMGNLRSVEKALEHVGVDGAIAPPTPIAVRDGRRRVLPGVGAFPKAMRAVRELGLDELIAERRDAGVADARHLPRHAAAVRLDSSEGEGATGLGLLPGEVEPLERRRPQGPAHRLVAGALGASRRRADRGPRRRPPFYFVHSFAPAPAEADDVLGTAAYGERVRLRGRARERLRRPVPPREVERAPACGLLANFAGICAGADAA